MRAMTHAHCSRSCYRCDDSEPVFLVCCYASSGEIDATAVAVRARFAPINHIDIGLTHIFLCNNVGALRRGRRWGRKRKGKMHDMHSFKTQVEFQSGLVTGELKPGNGLEADADVTYRREILLVTSLGAFMTPLDASIVSVALPSIANRFRMGYAEVIWVPVAYLLCLATLLLTFGRLSDVRGRKPFFTAGFALFTASSALCGLSQSAAMLVFFRGAQGVGAAMIGATSAAIVTEVFPARMRGRALGFNALAVYTGLSFGPTLSGVLVQSLGWSSIFYVNVPIGIVVTWIAAKRLKESSVIRRRGRHFDLLGAVSFTVGLSLVLLGLTLVGTIPFSSPLILGTLIGGGCVLAVFLAIESRRKQTALLDLGMFRGNRLFAAANVSALLNYTAYFAVPYFLSFYLQRVLSYSPLLTGLILFSMPLPMALLSPVSGWLSDRYGSRLFASLGMGLMCVSLFLLSQISASTSLVNILVALIGLGVGMGLFSAPNTSSVMGSVDGQHLGAASGTLSTMRFVGQALSLAILGALAATVIPPDVLATIFGGMGAGQVSSEVFLKGESLAFIAGAAFSFVGVLASLVRGKEKNEVENRVRLG
jgi:EmrB/QacA subfamily drug resistance transporter